MNCTHSSCPWPGVVVSVVVPVVVKLLVGVVVGVNVAVVVSVNVALVVAELVCVVDLDVVGDVVGVELSVVDGVVVWEVVRVDVPVVVGVVRTHWRNVPSVYEPMILFTSRLVVWQAVSSLRFPAKLHVTVPCTSPRVYCSMARFKAVAARSQRSWLSIKNTGSVFPCTSPQDSFPNLSAQVSITLFKTATCALQFGRSATAI